MSPSGIPPKGWITTLENQEKIPHTQNNRIFFQDWALAEHGNVPAWGGYMEGGAYNPFDSTLGSPESGYTSPPPGASEYNSIGVMNYANTAQGLDFTAMALNEPAYANLLADLRSGKYSVPDLEIAEGNSGWGRESGWPTGVVLGKGGIVPTVSPVGTPAGTGAVGGGWAAQLLQTMDPLYNPKQPGFLTQVVTLGTANIGQVLELLFVRGISTLIFLGVGYFGFKMLTNKGDSHGISGINAGDLLGAYNQSQNRQASSERVGLGYAQEQGTAQRATQAAASLPTKQAHQQTLSQQSTTREQLKTQQTTDRSTATTAKAQHATTQSQEKTKQTRSVANASRANAREGTKQQELKHKINQEQTKRARLRKKAKTATKVAAVAP